MKTAADASAGIRLRRARPAVAEREPKTPRRGRGGGQERLLKFLRDPDSYPDHPARVRIVQTHTAWVALTTRYAYKIKKPVNFGFLDFSTVAKRRRFCLREVILNARLCRGVHLGVAPIFQQAGRLSFTGGGEIVDYAVVMRRLPEQSFLLARLARGEVTAEHAAAIAETLSSFYASQPPKAEIAAWGRVEKLRISTDENFQQTRDFIGTTISRPAHAAIQAYTGAFYRQHGAAFAERIREGRILDCHGDLHLDHIHLAPRRLNIYDCIEFNDRFRYIDVANDAAFLAMDFDFHQRPDLGRHFVSELALRLHDPGLYRMLDFYKCYRAFVRGKVESFHQAAAGLSESERRASREAAERYFRLALRYAIAGSEASVLVVMGRIATGKSTLARALGRELGWAVFSSDRVRKELAGVPHYTRGSERQRRRLYGPSMTGRTYHALTLAALGQCNEGRSAIVEATFGTQQRRRQFREALARAGVRCCFIETQAADGTIRHRLAARDASGSEISDARLEDFASIDQAFEPARELPAADHIAVKTAETAEAVLLAVFKALALRRARAEAE